ncbi:MAG: hypothetical protein HC893_05945 [Chloroflexaceae bacterium]|nr:hypothetical protein [Chloroflexaceae bacterium]NJL33466.1 hypothetical protein [Chloroflexaceae bacterium]NJO04846.1 hypothetical protein [Chloroflexaceae bacterium]
MDVLENREQWLAEFQQGWLAHYEQTGETLWKIYNRPRNSTAPAGKRIDLRQSRLVLITSAGSYLAATQQPYDAANTMGDYTIRTYPTTTPLNDLAYAHDHYDHTTVNQDAQVLVPLRHLEDLTAAGMIGELAPNAISFMGYQPVVPRVLDETIPAVVDAVKAEQAHAALLVPA